MDFLFGERGLGLRFIVVVDGFGTLGDWSKCDGLSLEYDVFPYREGGQNDFEHRLPGRTKYSNVKLMRPLDRSSALVGRWVATVATHFRHYTAAITVLDAGGIPVTVWNLMGAYPAKWTGPTLDVNGNQVATETLEIAHHGIVVL